MSANEAARAKRARWSMLEFRFLTGGEKTLASLVGEWIVMSRSKDGALLFDQPAHLICDFSCNLAETYRVPRGLDAHRIASPDRGNSAHATYCSNPS